MVVDILGIDYFFFVCMCIFDIVEVMGWFYDEFIEILCVEVVIEKVV